MQNFQSQGTLYHMNETSKQSDSEKSALMKQNQFSYEELIQCAEGRLFGSGNAQLPMPPMLMVDRITSITENGGIEGKGQIIAEYDINPEHWFFGCHFVGDPVMPGCLGLDALWQLIGFYLGWRGGPGRGRALGVGEVKFSGQVTPQKKLVTYRIDMKKVIMRRLYMGVADAVMEVDGEEFYAAKDLRVGLYKLD